MDLFIIIAIIAVSKEVYRPPAAQGKPASFKLHDEEQTNASRSKLFLIFKIFDFFFHFYSNKVEPIEI